MYKKISDFIASLRVLQGFNELYDNYKTTVLYTESQFIHTNTYIFVFWGNGNIEVEVRHRDVNITFYQIIRPLLCA